MSVEPWPVVLVATCSTPWGGPNTVSGVIGPFDHADDAEAWALETSEHDSFTYQVFCLLPGPQSTER